MWISIGVSLVGAVLTAFLDHLLGVTFADEVQPVYIIIHKVAYMGAGAAIIASIFKLR